MRIDGVATPFNGSVTSQKLASPLTGPIYIADPNNRSKAILTKYPDGTGHNNAPTAFDLTSVYLHLGGTEYNTNSYRLIGFGYRHYLDSSHAAAVIGYQETSGSGNDMGRLLFATRNVTTDTAPTIRITIEPDGQVLLEAGYIPGSDNAVPNKKYVDDQTKNKAAIIALTSIADPTTATAEDCANKINEIIAALQA